MATTERTADFRSCGERYPDVLKRAPALDAARDVMNIDASIYTHTSKWSIIKQSILAFPSNRGNVVECSVIE